MWRRAGRPSATRFPVPDVDEVPFESGCGGHLGTDQVRAAAAALAAFEVAVRGRGAPLARLEDVGVHAQAHRATRLAPLEAGLLEDPVEALLLRLGLHLLGAGHHHRPHGAGDPAALYEA